MPAMMFLRAVRSLNGSSHASKIALRGLVAFRVEAVNRTVARIDVEVDGELVARRLVRVAGQMLRDPRLRSEQSFLFAAPQRDANRAARLRADRLENAHRLEDRRRTVGVVGRAGRRVPRVEVGADHHDLVAQRRVGAGQLGDHVVAARVLREVAALDVDPDRHRNAIFQKSNEVVVMLARDDDRRDGVRAGVARLEKDRSVFAAARLEHRAHADVVQQRGDPLRFTSGPPRPPPPRPPRPAAGGVGGGASARSGSRDLRG